MRKAARFLPALLLALLAACASNPAPAPAPANEPNAAPGENEPKTVVRVENDNFLDMTIYVRSTGGAERRLGQVTGHSVATFTIPKDFVFGASSLQFRADPVGGRSTPFSQTISVSPGDTLRMTIPAT